ncbi:MAG: NAD(+) synthase [Synergistales bacterium]|nr:NAD(+) synthase [Synergistales bacterium]MDY6401096.1 NAD(+) synthase [Synergistales bacterium]MDY6404689.1 NAD(+) synthase [Synergistales bacterium]MDY6410895.1 NAD(+) synthase [Synergistales bacterium]MDY6415134.1 NAD(+) synthase [Synergistales bacterium]
MRNIINRCEQWLRDEVETAHASGIVLGLSGGIDSSVLAAIGREALGRDKVLGIIMPCHSIDDDEADARLLIKALDINFMRVDLSGVFDLELDAIGSELNSLVKSNLKARLRMVTLYAAAQSKNFLVCGTSNKSEYETGYFTKFGDSGVDLMPLANFLKREIREAAKILNVPEKIINKAPSAGLYEGQTDEGDMGFSYDVLDEYLATGKIDSEKARERIDVMRRRSEHKRKPIPIFKF